MQIYKWRGLKGTYSTGQDGTVSIAADCGLVGPDDQILVGVKFSMSCRMALKPSQPALECVPGFCRSKVEHGAGQPPASNANLRKGRIYTSFSPLCLYKHIMGWHLEYPLYRKLCGLWFGGFGENV
jgi:hypothetical protein